MRACVPHTSTCDGVWKNCQRYLPCGASGAAFAMGLVRSSFSCSFFCSSCTHALSLYLITGLIPLGLVCKQGACNSQASREGMLTPNPFT